MNQRFKLRFDEMRENNQSKSLPDSPSEEQEIHYTGHVFNLCILLVNGNRRAFEYAYLQSQVFDQSGEENIIKLNFTSATVTLYGFCLESLSTELLRHIPEFIKVIDSRYLPTYDSKEGLVTKVIIEEKEN